LLFYVKLTDLLNSLILYPFTNEAFKVIMLKIDHSYFSGGSEIGGQQQTLPRFRKARFTVKKKYFQDLLSQPSSDAKASKCHLKFSSRMVIFIKLVYLSSVISLKWQ